MVRDSAGNLFGTTELGGAEACGYTCGVVYEVTPAAGKRGPQQKAIYKFCKTGNCAKGANPESGLVIDTSGNLYGIVTNYGKHSAGGIFRVSSDGKNYSVLHSFCAKSNCTDGGGTLNTGTALTYQGAASGAPYDGVSPLYGVTVQGGTTGSGVIFKLAPPNGGKAWKYTVLYSFCSQAQCADGLSPTGLLADASGVLYGTTMFGGGHNIDSNHDGGGTVFKLTGQTFQTLYSFCAQANCSDGAYPESVVIDAQGNLVGVTIDGGNANLGTIYKIDTAGAHTKLHDFCLQANCTDGASPTAAPVIDPDGNLFGVAAGGSQNRGMIYKFDGTLHVLYNFCVGGGSCSDGASPHTPLIQDGAGNFYGQTQMGGLGLGTVFEFTP